MKLAKKYYGDENKYRLIMEANGITDPNKIAIGDVLKIPPLK
jgi:nucleoid-associated protein YgaU